VVGLPDITGSATATLPESLARSDSSLNTEGNMSKSLVIIGAPSSAGAYAPGQEQAPAALRAAGLLELIAARGIQVEDRGDVPGFRWSADKEHPRAMNVNVAATVASAVAKRVAEVRAEDAAVLVLGGDCTVELGTVAGVLSHTESIGLIYVDLDTDLNR